MATPLRTEYRRLQKIDRLLSAMTQQLLKAALAAEKRNEVEKQEALRRIASFGVEHRHPQKCHGPRGHNREAGSPTKNDYRPRETSGVCANSSQCARTTFTSSTNLSKSTGLVKNTLAPNS